MPKLGMEPLRREALIQATITEVGEAGGLDVTVSQIARRAGMSPALAHHYFGTKEFIFLAAMRRILGDFGRSVRARRQTATTPRARIEAVIEASFGADQYERAITVAWLVFYVEAQRSDEAARLLHVYLRRLNSNLLHDLKRLVDGKAARRIAQGIAALIDGIYLRQAHRHGQITRHEAKAMLFDYLTRSLRPSDEPACR